MLEFPEQYLDFNMSEGRGVKRTAPRPLVGQWTENAFLTLRYLTFIVNYEFKAILALLSVVQRSFDGVSGESYI